MSRILDNIEQELLGALRATLAVSKRADFCVGYLNLRGWQAVGDLMQPWVVEAGQVCRVLVGMQRPPSDEIRALYRAGTGDEGLDNATAIHLKGQFDTDALREALNNALVHRDYACLDPVRMCWQDDELVISNPGGFVEGVTLDTLLTTEPKPHNPRLADAFKRIGLVERTGRGVDLIYSGMLRFGRPAPDYSESRPELVKLTISTEPADLAFVRLVLEEETRGPEPLAENPIAEGHHVFDVEPPLPRWGGLRHGWHPAPRRAAIARAARSRSPDRPGSRAGPRGGTGRRSGGPVEGDQDIGITVRPGLPASARTEQREPHDAEPALQLGLVLGQEA